MFQQIGQGPEKARQVHDNQWMVYPADPLHGQYLEEFVESPRTAGQDDDGVAQIQHSQLARRQVLCEFKVRQSLVPILHRAEEFRRDAQHLATGRQYSIGQRPHASSGAASIHELQSLLSKQHAQLIRRPQKTRVQAG